MRPACRIDWGACPSPSAAAPSLSVHGFACTDTFLEVYRGCICRGRVRYFLEWPESKICVGRPLWRNPANANRAGGKSAKFEADFARTETTLIVTSKLHNSVETVFKRDIIANLNLAIAASATKPRSFQTRGNLIFALGRPIDKPWLSRRTRRCGVAVLRIIKPGCGCVLTPQI